MKKYMRVLILALVLTALMCLPAFAGYDSCELVNDEVTSVVGFEKGVEKLTSITQTGVQANAQYLLLVLDDSYGVDYPTDDNILFVDQAKATAGGVVTFNNDDMGIYPSVAKNSTVYLAGAGMKNAEAEDGPQKIATLGVLGVTVNGKVTSFLTGNATVKLLDNTDAVIATTTADAAGNYSFATVANGTYTMEVSKEHHVTREYEITVGSEAVAKDLKICPKGDVDMNGIVDIIDHQCLFEHLQTINEIKDAYQLKIANVKDDDAVVDILDHQCLFEHLQGIEVLFPVN